MSTHAIILFLVSFFIIVSQSNTATADEIDTYIDKVGDQIDSKSNSFFDNSLSNTFEPLTDEEASNNEINESQLKSKKINQIDYKNLRTDDVSDDIAVIQKNILNKTARFHVSLSGALSTNDVYYRTMGLQLKTTYHINEKLGISGFGYLLTSMPRSEIGDIESNQGLSINNLIYLKSYYGLSLYYNSIYGKMSLFNSKIVPFEIFFELGGGVVGTQSDPQNNGLSLGTGALFTLSSKSALKTDLNWLFYNSKNIVGERMNSNTILLSLGYSYFLGEAK